MCSYQIGYFCISSLYHILFEFMVRGTDIVYYKRNVPGLKGDLADQSSRNSGVKLIPLLTL